MKTPPHTRLILAADDLLEQFGTRTEDGRRITAEWGDVRPEGWYEPRFTAHDDDGSQDMRDGAALRKLREALPEMPDDEVRPHIDIYHGERVVVSVGVEGAMYGHNPWMGKDTRPDGCWHDTDGAELPSGEAATIADAADKCREAL